MSGPGVSQDGGKVSMAEHDDDDDDARARPREEEEEEHHILGSPNYPRLIYIITA